MLFLFGIPHWKGTAVWEDGVCISLQSALMAVADAESSCMTVTTTVTITKGHG